MNSHSATELGFAAAPARTTLVIEGVSAGYGDSLVLDGVSCQVQDGDIVGILGPNGSGKSTLLKTVMGLTNLHSGEIHWRGQRIDHLPTHVRARLGLGYVPQVENVFSELTVVENLQVGGFSVTSTQLRERSEQIYEVFGPLAERRQTLAGDLSGGERRMLAIGTALMMGPACLLLDEPSADLSPGAVDTLFARLEYLRSQLPIPIVLVEQNVPRALEFTERVLVLTRGRVRLARPSNSITSQELGDLFMEVGRA